MILAKEENATKTYHIIGNKVQNLLNYKDFAPF